MKPDFKVGDRVAVYEKGRRVGTVDKIDPDDTQRGVLVRWANKDAEWFHPKQCRRLRKRERRRWTLTWSGTDFDLLEGEKPEIYEKITVIEAPRKLKVRG